MTMDCRYLKVLLGLTMGLFAPLCSTYEMAKLHRNPTDITSSTLAWISVRPGDSIPPNTVPVGAGGPYWCRAREHAIWMSGAVVDGACKVPFLGRVLLSETYQVLVSLNGSARLVNVPWDSLLAFPPNPVATPDMLLALSLDTEGGAVLPGYVDPKERRAHFLRGTDAVKFDGGHLVTEKEPIAYRLEDVRLGEKTRRLLHEEILFEFVLENDENSPHEVNHNVVFELPYVVYFGRMKGTVVGLPTAVSGPDTSPVDIKWGMRNELNRNRSHTVVYHLPPRTSVKVRLIAVIRNLEGSYSARLVSIYDDQQELDRWVEGPHTEQKLAELKAEFGQVTSLDGGDGLLTPEEGLPGPKTMILLHSTTTPVPDIPEEGILPSGSTSGNQILPRPQEVGVSSGASLASLGFLILIFGVIV